MIFKRPQILEEIINLSDKRGSFLLKEGEYIIENELYIPKDVTLIILPNTYLLFKEEVGITCEGKLKIYGKEGLEVFLKAYDNKWKNIYIKGGEVYLEHVEIKWGNGRIINEHILLNLGGAIYLLNRKVVIIDSFLKYNKAQNKGGALFNLFGKMTLKRNVLNNNSAERGGAIFNYWGISYLKRNIIEKNSPLNEEVHNEYGKLILKK